MLYNSPSFISIELFILGELTANLLITTRNVEGKWNAFETPKMINKNLNWNHEMFNRVEDMF